MKIRCGFVTNSSSSSFLIAFKCEETVEQEIDAIFKGKRCRTYSSFMTGKELKQQAKAELLADSKNRRVSLEELCEILRREFSCIARYEYYYAPRKYLEDDGGYLQSAEYKALEAAYIDAQMKEVLSKLEGKEYYVYTSFSDNDGLVGSYMEHDLMPSVKNTICCFNHH